VDFHPVLRKSNVFSMRCGDAGYATSCPVLGIIHR